MKSSDLRTYTLVETMIPGTKLFFGIALTGVTDAQAGLALEAIRRWANANVLGGGSARGRGSFLASLNVTRDGKVIGPMFKGYPPDYQLDGKFAPLIEAMQKEVAASCKVVDMTAVYPASLEAA